MEKRQPYLIVVCGKKKSGKTHDTLDMIDETIKGNPRTGAKPRKALILDINGEFTQFRTIGLKNVGLFSASPKIEVRRLTIFKSDGKKMTLNEIAQMLNEVLDKYKNGLLLVEDITRYISDSLPSDVIGAICTQRHVGVDLILHFQMLSKAAHPKLVSNMNLLRLHKCAIPPERVFKNFGDFATPIKLAQILVNIEYAKRQKSKYWVEDKKNRANSNVYFCAWVDTDLEIVKGDFTREMFAEAIHEYINENERETVGKYLKKKDRSGKLLYNYQTAYSQVEKDLMMQYYGNKN